MDFTSPWHILLIMLVIVLLFGGKKVPELMKGIGEGIREFRNASKVENESGKKEPEKKELEKLDSGKKD
jgi:sec-independent protein translocase protein TatA